MDKNKSICNRCVIKYANASFKDLAYGFGVCNYCGADKALVTNTDNVTLIIKPPLHDTQ